MQAPRTLRETFLLFGNYNPDTGIKGLLSSVDWTNVGPRQVYSAALGRLPENAEVARTKPSYSASDHYLEVINSLEFQRKVRDNFLQAFPEKLRLFAVHVPRTGGTDLEETFLHSPMPALHFHLGIRALTPPEQLFAALSISVQRTASSKAIAFVGHDMLSALLARQHVRYWDRVVTTLRKPIDLAVSYANFIVGRLVDLIGHSRADVDEWYDYLQIPRLPPNPPTELLEGVARAVLQCQKIVLPNITCRFLGDGTMASAVDMLVRTDAEITEVGRYSAWRKSRFGVEFTKRHNPGRPYLQVNSIPADDLRYLEAILQEDQKLYDFVVAKIKPDALSVHGRDL